MDSVFRSGSSSALVELKRRIGNLISASHGYTEIVERSARLLECPLSLWDYDGSVIAAAETRSGIVDALAREFERLWASTSGKREAIRSALAWEDSPVVALSVADGCGPGKMLVIHPGERDTDIERCRAVAPDVGFVIVVEGQRQRAVRTTEERLRTSFRHELLDPAALAGTGLERIAARARALGYELATSYWVVVIESQGVQRSGASSPAALLATRIGRGDKRTLTVEQGERVVMLIPEERLKRDRFATLGESLSAAMIAVGNECGVTLYSGLSESSVALGGLAAEVQRVSRNLDLNRSLGYRHALVVAEPIRAYKLLMAVAEPRELLDYWNETIRELYQYDVLNGTTLIRTLEIFFACNYNAIEASRRLFVHRNTMTRRLRRIEDILHVDLNDAETAFRFQLAIRVHHIVISQKLQP